MEKKEYIVTPQGSLSLLALGHIGLIKWREAIQNQKNNQELKEINKKSKEDEKK